MRTCRLERAREAQKARPGRHAVHGDGTSARQVLRGWNRLKPGLRYAMLCGDDPPVLFEQDDLGCRRTPLAVDSEENVRAMRGSAAGPISRQQVGKFITPSSGDEEERRRRDEAGRRFHRHQYAAGVQDASIDWVDGMSPMMEARAVERRRQECRASSNDRGRRALGNVKFLRPGITETRSRPTSWVPAPSPGWKMWRTSSSSGPNTWRTGAFRPHHQPGDIVFAGSGRFSWNGYKSCYYRVMRWQGTERRTKKGMHHRCSGWPADRRGQGGTTTRDHSAMAVLKEA